MFGNSSGFGYDARKVILTLRDEGNKATKAGSNEEAFTSYSHALKLMDDHRGVLSVRETAQLYSNRSTILLKLNKHTEALRDAEICIQIDNTWYKGYMRKARALNRVGKALEVHEAFVEGYKVAQLLKEDTDICGSMYMEMVCTCEEFKDTWAFNHSKKTISQIEVSREVITVALKKMIDGNKYFGIVILQEVDRLQLCDFKTVSILTMTNLKGQITKTFTRCDVTHSLLEWMPYCEEAVIACLKAGADITDLQGADRSGTALQFGVYAGLHTDSTKLLHYLMSSVHYANTSDCCVLNSVGRSVIHLIADSGDTSSVTNMENCIRLLAQFPQVDLMMLDATRRTVLDVFPFSNIVCQVIRESLKKTSKKKKVPTATLR